MKLFLLGKTHIYYDMITLMLFPAPVTRGFCLWDDNEILGGKLKGIRTLEEEDGLWYAPDEGATNEVGFTAILDGYMKK